MQRNAINLLRTPNFHIEPLQLGSHDVEQIRTYKILGVIQSDNLKWNYHVEYFVKKARKKLYSLRVLPQSWNRE